MRRAWRLLSAWTALANGGALGVGGALIASLWVSPPWAALIGGSLAAVSAVAANRAKQRFDRQWELRQELPDRITLQVRPPSPWA
jgi:hypothetical protein